MGLRDLSDVADVPVQVRAMAGTFLREIDEVRPGLIDGFFLTGSVALGDYRPGFSDIDFLAVTSRVLDDDALALIADIHVAMPQSPHFDGIYLDRDTMATTPDENEVVPHCVKGELHTDRPCDELNPALWLTLNQCGIAVRWPSKLDFGAPDANRVRAWSLDNLRSYWQPLAGRIRQAVAGRDAFGAVRSESLMWVVLGPARLHYTLAMGEIASKTDAGRYAAEHFPQWHEQAELAVACREGGPVEFTTTDALAAADMVEGVVDDAWRRWG